MAFDLQAVLAQLRALQDKETLADIMADPLGRGLLAAAVALLFLGVMLLSPKKEEKSELDKALQGRGRQCTRSIQGGGGGGSSGGTASAVAGVAGVAAPPAKP